MSIKEFKIKMTSESFQFMRDSANSEGIDLRDFINECISIGVKYKLQNNIGVRTCFDKAVSNTSNKLKIVRS